MEKTAGNVSGLRHGGMTRWFALRGLGIAACALLLPLATQANAPEVGGPLRAFIVGGGPSLDYNQVAIESNVRYVGKLLPPGTVRSTLFADGDVNHATVLYEDNPRALPAGERLFTLVVHGTEDQTDNALHHKKPNLGTKLDGGSNPTDFNRVFGQITEAENAPPTSPLLLYFTGHGSSDNKNNENNVYDMWSQTTLSVKQLAKQIAKLPASVPVTVVMVQCHSGAFTNLQYAGGDPKAKPIDRDIAGFFATTAERLAAGCTSEVDEAEYRDFTSYFFAALTGRDRVGRHVTGADYNHDGRVGMDEAYYYTLANDRSIDVPVCTSDMYVRRFVVTGKESDVFKPAYSDVLKWATPAQRYALNTLAKSLRRETGEDRLQSAYDDMFRGQFKPESNAAARREAKRKFDETRKEAKRTLFARWPDLRNAALPDYKLAKKQAIAYLTEKSNNGTWKALLESADALFRTDSDEETKDIAEAHLLRFIRLGKTIILTHRLRETGDAETKARFERLLEAEGRTVLPPVDRIADAKTP